MITRTEQLIKYGLDGSICVNDEDIYNKMNKAANTIRDQLFNSEHLSWYKNKIMLFYMSVEVSRHLDYY